MLQSLVQVPRSHVASSLQTRSPVVHQAVPFWASQGPLTLSCFLCLLSEGVGQGTCLGSTHQKPCLSHLCSPTSVSTWHFSGSLHAKPGEAWNGDPVHKLDTGT